ncbi:MAG TPA: APC family permease [Gemmatimonadaceae bacterium]|nr:APC family permease [Gemmatimonadaceae bacterium]
MGDGSPPTGRASPPPLLRVLGTAFGLAIAVGATVGGGILRTPGEIAAALPSAALFMAVWVFGGLVTLLGANIFSELGAMMPHAGGPYVYARRAFGNSIGFFVGYTDWINWCLGPVVLTIIVGEYMGGLIPALAGHAMAVDFVTLGGLAVLQWIGVRSGGRTQEITTLLKALAFAALVVAAFVVPHATLAAPARPVPHGTSLLLAFGVAMQGVIFTYDAYYAVLYCGEEMRDPGREIPRSMLRGVWLVIIIYLLINAAYLAVVPASRIAGDPFVGATMARALFGQRGDTVIRLIMIISVLGAINAELMAIPRILLAMSRDGLFPRQAARVNAGGTPHVALALSLVVIVAFLLSGSFNAVLAFDSLLIIVMYAFSFIAFFALRLREPNAARPYRAWGYPVLPALALAIAVALVVAIAVGDVRSALIVLAVLLASWPASRLARRFGRAGGEAPGG